MQSDLLEDYSSNVEGTLEVAPTARVRPINPSREHQYQYRANADDGRDYPRDDRLRPRYPPLRQNDHQIAIRLNERQTSISPNWEPYQHNYVSPPMSGIIRARSNLHLNAESQGSLRHFPSVPSHLNYPSSQDGGFVQSHHRCPYNGSPEFLPSYERSRQESLNSLESRYSSIENTEVMFYKLQIKDKDQRIEGLERRIQSLEKYLQNLPTREDMEKMQRQSSELEREKDQSFIQIKQLKRSLDKTKEEIKSKDTRIETLERRNAAFRVKLETAKEGIEKTLNCDKEITAERDYLLIELKRVKKELEAKDQSLQSLRVEYDRVTTDLEEKMENDKFLEATLRKEIRYKEDTISTLKTQLREIDAKREQLLEENLSLQEKTKECKNELCEIEERYVLEKKLLTEMRRALVELKGLTKIVSDATKGNDPNLSTIFGPPVNFSLEPKKEPINQNSISKDIEEATEMKVTLRELREKISDNYAEYLGDKLWCATQ